MAESELHKQLVAHLTDSFRDHGLEIVSVDAAGQERLERRGRMPWSRWRRPDVVGRNGKLFVYGDAKLGARDAAASIGQLADLAVMCSELVICVPQGELEATARALDQEWGLRRFGRVGLLGAESTKWMLARDLL